MVYYEFKLDISSSGGYRSYIAVVSILVLRCDDINMSNCIKWWASFSELWLFYTDRIGPEEFVGYSWENRIQYIAPSVWIWLNLNLGLFSTSIESYSHPLF